MKTPVNGSNGSFHVNRDKPVNPTRELLGNRLLVEGGTNPLFVDGIPANVKAAKQAREMEKDVTREPRDESAHDANMVYLKVIENNRPYMTLVAPRLNAAAPAA